MRCTRPIISVCCWTSVALLVGGGAGAQTSAVARTPSPAAEAAATRTASQAAAQLRRLYFLDEANDGAEVGASLVRRFAAGGQVRFWYVANLVQADRRDRADSIASRIDTTARDPWLIATRALAKLHSPIATRANFAEAHRLALKARSLAPHDPDFAWLAVYTMGTPGFPVSNGAEVMSYIDSVAPTVGYPTRLRQRRASALLSTSSAGIAAYNVPPDTAKRNAALREMASIRATDSLDFEVMYEGSAYLRTTAPDSALALMKRAVALAPRAAVVRRNYWALIDAQRSLPAAEKKAMIAADRSAFLAQTDSAPWALAAAATSMQRPVTDPGMVALEERLLAKAPHSTWAEDVLLRRAAQWNDSIYAARDSTSAAPKSDTLVMRARYYAAMEAFIAKPWVASQPTHDQAVMSLFFAVRTDSSYPTNRMVKLVNEVLETKMALHPSVRFGETAHALAERKVDFALAEKSARKGLTLTAGYFRNFPGYFFSSVGEEADALDASNATLHDDIGLVFYYSGRYAEADTEMTHAVDLNKKNPELYRDLGRLRIAQGRDADAELAFAQGMTLRFRGVNPNQKELEAIYQKNHGSMDGWAAYLSGLVEKERVVRRDKILATRDATPKAVSPFKLDDLRQRLVDSDSLRGKYTVVNFWGTWCGPCVAEMPELQQFYNNYRGDASVAILTISNDKDLQTLKDWVGKHNLTVPTLFDDGYVANTAHVSAFPTTWFIDPDGHVEFSATGNTGALVEEWTWRLEAMRKGPPPKPVAVP